MYKYLVSFVLLTPLIGIILVENGEYAGSVGRDGYPNGATLAYTGYVVIVILTAIVSSKAKLIKYNATMSDSCCTASISGNHISSCRFNQFAGLLFIFNIAFLFIMLFGFNGIMVWLGSTEKGVFRATLGPWGLIPYLMTKFIAPALFAYATVLYKRTVLNNLIRLLWWSNAIVIFLVGSVWGFKTTGLMMLLPALLILNWEISFLKLIKLFSFFILTLVIFFKLFDANLMENTNVVMFLLNRLTVLQGDVSWHIWDLYIKSEPIPNYWPSLLAAFGDTPLTLFGVDKNNLNDWMSYHYDWMVTYMAGLPLETIRDGHSIVGTPFSEGIVAGGYVGVILIALIAGLLVGRSYFYLNFNLTTDNALRTSFISTFFCFHTFAWLSGGAITQLFHISIIISLIVTYITLQVIIKWSNLLRTVCKQ